MSAYKSLNSRTTALRENERIRLQYAESEGNRAEGVSCHNFPFVVLVTLSQRLAMLFNEEIEQVRC